MSNTYYQSSSTTSYTSSSATDGRTVGQSYSKEISSDPQGTTVRTSRQNLGEPAVQNTRHYDVSGREISGHEVLGDEQRPQRRTEKLTDRTEPETEQRYRERIEDEYAKREGGA